jgi:sirohydrochlorin ferrochelatase
LPHGEASDKIEVPMAIKELEAAVLIFAHGSSVEEANQSVHVLARQVQEIGPFAYVRAAFLDPFQPGLESAVDQAVKAGYRRVVVIPYFLTLGLHMRRDFPELLARQRMKHPQVEILAGESLDDHPLMASIIAGRAQEAMR